MKAAGELATRVQVVWRAPGCDRRHFIDEEDVRSVLDRLPRQRWSRLKKVVLNDESRGGKRLGYTTTRGRHDIALCAQPPRIRMPGPTPAVFGALPSVEWPPLAVRRYMLYEVLLHEVGHLQISDATATKPRRKFADEKHADDFAAEMRASLWSEPPPARLANDRAHAPPTDEEMHALSAGWVQAVTAFEASQGKHGIERIALLERALEHHADHVRAAVSLAYARRVRDEDGDLPRILALLEHAHSLDPCFIPAELALADALARSGALDRAEAHFEHGMRRPFRGLERTIFHYASSLAAGGRPARAGIAMKAMLRKNDTALAKECFENFASRFPDAFSFVRTRGAARFYA